MISLRCGASLEAVRLRALLAVLQPESLCGKGVLRSYPSPGIALAVWVCEPQMSRAACELLGCCAEMRRCCMLVAVEEHSACSGPGCGTSRRARSPKRQSRCM